MRFGPIGATNGAVLRINGMIRARSRVVCAAAPHNGAQLPLSAAVPGVAWCSALMLTDNLLIYLWSTLALGEKNTECATLFELS